MLNTLRNLVASRLAQLAARFVALTLVSYAGYSAGDADAVSQTVAAGVSAAVMVGFDLVSHRIQKGQQAK